MARTLANISSPSPPDDRDDKIAEGRDDPSLFAAFREENARKTRGFEAPEACIACVEAACRLPFDEGIAFERAQFRVRGDTVELRPGYTEDGLRIDRQIIALRPGDALAHYNLACSLSLTGRLDEGILALNHAVELGYDDAEWLLSDRDIERLWEHPKFPQLLGRIRELGKPVG